MKPGDAYITNDPWMGTGRLNDFVIASRPLPGAAGWVALFSAPAISWTSAASASARSATDVFMEGLYIPMWTGLDKGKANKTLMAMIPEHAAAGRHRGRRLLAGRCNDVGARRLFIFVRHRHAGPARRARGRPVARGGAGRDRQAARGTWHNAMTVRRLRRAGDTRSHAPPFSRAASTWTTPGCRAVSSRGIDVPACLYNRLHRVRPGLRRGEGPHSQQRGFARAAGAFFRHPRAAS